MKKTLLALVTASALIVSGSALAAFADATQGEGSGANAQIKITGTVANTNPNWMWQIPAAAQGSVTDVALKRITGVAVGDNTEFAISKTEMSILEGYMSTPSPTGVAGITPVITIGGKDMAEVDCSMIAGGCSVEISATNGGATAGKIIAHLEASAAAAFIGGTNGDSYITGAEVGDGSREALEVLRTQGSFNESYPGVQATIGLTYRGMEALLSNVNSKKISNSRVVMLASSKLVVPTDAIPDTWAATLPMTISLK